MFSLKSFDEMYKKLECDISRYLGMFSLKSCPPKPLFLAGSRGDLRGKPLQGVFSRFYFSKNARKRPFYAVRGKLKNYLSEL